jgi:hypothetical protein
MRKLPTISPLTLTRLRAPFDHPDWTFELKHDGILSDDLREGSRGSRCQTSAEPIRCSGEVDQDKESGVHANSEQTQAVRARGIGRLRSLIDRAQIRVRRGHPAKIDEHNLDESEVRVRLDSYHAEAVTDELYDFGRILLNDAVDRISKIDSKATAIAGYAGGIITVLISTSGLWTKSFDQYAIAMVFIAGICAAFAGGAAVHSMALQETLWFTPNVWIKKDCLSEREPLRRYHLLAIWQVVTSHQFRYRTKVARLRRAQYALVISGILLTLVFLEIAWRHATFKDLIIQRGEIASWSSPGSRATGGFS